MKAALRRLISVQSIHIPLKQCIERVNCDLCIGANRTQRYLGTGDNSERHDAQQALRIHLAGIGFQPDAALKLVRLLYKICSLLVVQSRFAADNDFLVERNTIGLYIS